MARTLGRRDQGGYVAVVEALAVVAIAVAAVLLFALASSPYRQMNQPPAGQKCIAYGRAGGTYAVSAFLGAIHGEFKSAQVVQITDPNDHGPFLDLGSLFGKKGNAFVQIQMRGPAGAEVVAWQTPKVHIDIELTAQASGEAKRGDFESGAACFWEHGTSSWTMSLKFEDEGSGVVDTLATVQKTLEV
jgi:hypothetical protein